GNSQRPLPRRPCDCQQSGQNARGPVRERAQDQHRRYGIEVTPPLYIALRFLLHRKRALLLSLAGVVFGVAIFIGTQAQTQGFTQYFIDSSLGSNGALTVRSRFQERAQLLQPPKSKQP